MKLLLCLILILVLLVLFAVWPGKRRDALRAPFLGRNFAHRGYFGKDQRPPQKTTTASSWMFSSRPTIGWWFSTMIRWTV